MGQPFIGYPIITAAGAQIVTGAASATVAIPACSGSTAAMPRFIRLSATAACCFRLFPAAGGAAVNTDTQIQPGDSLIIAVPDGYTKISAIQQAAAGVLQISPLENA